MDTHDQPTERLIVGYRQLSNFVTHELGCPYSYSTALKYGSPAINIGPPAESYWGRLPAFRPSRVAEWAKGRLKPAGAMRSRAMGHGAGLLAHEAFAADATTRAPHRPCSTGNSTAGPTSRPRRGAPQAQAASKGGQS
jgi:hypothetical protein